MFDDEDMWRGLLAEAYRTATQSPDPSSQAGTLVCSPLGTVLSRACNTFPPGIHATPENLERPRKYEVVEHAERGALYALLRANAGMTRDPVMVAPWAACTDCARAIVLSGIKTLVRHSDVMERSPERWLESITLADEILVAGNVDIVEIAGPVGGPTILHCGEEWTP